MDLLLSEKITHCNLMQLTPYSAYVIMNKIWTKFTKTTFEKEYVASRPCDRFEGGSGNAGKCIYCKQNAPNKVSFTKAY